MLGGRTYIVFQKLATIVAHAFQDLLDLVQEAWSRDCQYAPNFYCTSFRQLTDVEDGHGELDVSEMSRTIGQAFFTSRTLVGAVDGAEFGVIQALLSRPLTLLVHGLWVFNVAHTHVLDLFWREYAELNLAHLLLRRGGFLPRKVRHDCGVSCGLVWTRMNPESDSLLLALMPEKPRT